MVSHIRVTIHNNNELHKHITQHNHTENSTSPQRAIEKYKYKNNKSIRYFFSYVQNEMRSFFLLMLMQDKKYILPITS